MTDIPKEMSGSDALFAPTANFKAMLLRAIARELVDKIIPALNSPDAVDRAQLARLVTDNLAADLDVAPSVATRLAPQMRRVIQDALDADGKSLPSERLQALSAELQNAPADVDALRNIAARVVRLLADQGAGRNAPAALTAPAGLKALGRVDALWLQEFCAASVKLTEVSSTPASSATNAAPSNILTADHVTKYLRRRFPESHGITATELVRVPGGRSKKTYFVSISGSDLLPNQVVIRQDYALKYAGTRIVDEYRPLMMLAQRGLPVPRPLHLETESSEVGPPFMFVPRFSGKPPGSYFGMIASAPGAFRDLAAMLGQLHCMDATGLGAADAVTNTDQLGSVIAQYQRKWRDNATRASPVIDYAYAWASDQCHREPGLTAFVHGDCGPYNFLIDNDRLTVILDWEFAHVGDPAEDLGIARVYAEGSLAWPEFLDIYRANGGPSVSEPRVQLGMLTQFLKGTTLVAASGRNYQEGGTNEFVKGATSFTGLRLIEQRIADLLQRFGAF